MTADSLVLVPLEATEVMVNSGTDAIQNEGNAFIATRKGYRAMIASRPPVGEEVVEQVARRMCCPDGKCMFGGTMTDPWPTDCAWPATYRKAARAILAMLEGR